MFCWYYIFVTVKESRWEGSFQFCLSGIYVPAHILMMLYIMLQAEVAQREGLPSTELAVYHAGTPLEDEMFLAQQLTDGATLEVSVRMLGGKVHGSLARAGKVKGQTPKVISRKLEQRCCSGSRVADRTLSDPFNIPWLFSMSHLLHARSILCIYMQTPKLFWIQWRWQPIQLLYVPHLSILKTFTQAVFSWIAWRNPVTVDFLLKDLKHLHKLCSPE